MNHIFILDEKAYIPLCDLLKVVGLVQSGGEAKLRILNHEVLRNGEVETRKTAKIRDGEVIEMLGDRIDVKTAPYK